MQAGESLSFITVPEELAISESYSDDERAYVLYTFYHATKDLIQHPSGVTRSLERPEEIGIVTAKEAAFQVPYVDGSYLYFVAYGHEFEGDYLDLGLSITEHTEEGDYLGGFSFELTGADLRYAAHHSPDTDGGEGFDVDRKYHFSLLDQYEHKDELEMLAFSDDEQTRSSAQQSLDEWTEEVELALTSKDIGLSWSELSPMQMNLLSRLLEFVVPLRVPKQ